MMNTYRGNRNVFYLNVYRVAGQNSCVFFAICRALLSRIYLYTFLDAHKFDNIMMQASLYMVYPIK